MEITELTLTQTLKALGEKKFSEEELNNAYLTRTKSLNANINAYITVLEPYKGIPAAIKDVLVAKDVRTTAGSKILEDFVPPYSATVVDRLESHNVSILGKTNCDEFAMGSSGENSAYGVIRNPWDVSKVPGGSSSGSAAAVSADMCVFALGTDTGGSIRQPASLCGVVGLKPTYGLVSRYGLIAYGSSLDCVGPLAKSVEDAGQVLDWISGPDGKDSNCGQRSFKYDEEKIKGAIKGLKVGVPKEYLQEGLEEGTKDVIQKALSQLDSLGAELVDVELPHSRYAIAAYYIIATSEASSNLALFDGIRFGRTRDLFGPEVKRRIMLGTFSLSVGYYDDYFARAAKVRTLVIRDFEKAFAKCDVIAGPVSPTAAWDIGAKVDDPLAMYLSDIYTVTANLAGIPGISVPAGFSNDLPVGLQLLGPKWSEETLLRVAYNYEQNTEWHLAKPDLAVSA
ncbi:MAG: Asp-tRNA(Asn)/Glu-tRNA(Gln) amidotransferase subunit GatA [Candidatus Blackburnbacteria bacterium]|nr:Asp-tRNA(Asn)/Glu-tRNA(Gln) amidotransferase subunit GatA [Candidatus Blackburnbacteria bacterium]